MQLKYLSFGQLMHKKAFPMKYNSINQRTTN